MGDVDLANPYKSCKELNFFDARSLSVLQGGIFSYKM